MGKSGKLESSTLADREDSASFCLDKTEPELSLSLQEWLVHEAANSDDVRYHLRSALQKVTIDHLRTVAKAVQARQTGVSLNGDIVERLFALSKVGCLKGPSSGEEEPSWPGLTYMNNRIKKALADLPKYEGIAFRTKS